MAEYFGLDFPTFLLVISLLFFILILDFWRWTVRESISKPTNEEFKIIYYCEILSNYKDNNDKTRKNIGNQENIKKLHQEIKDISWELEELPEHFLDSLEKYQKKKKGDTMVHMSIRYILGNLLYMLYYIPASPLKEIHAFIMHFRKEKRFNVYWENYLTESTRTREGFILNCLIASMSSLAYIWIGSSGLFLNIVYAILNYFGIVFIPLDILLQLINLSIILIGFCVLIISIIYVILHIWSQYQWKYFWKKQFLIRMTDAILNKDYNNYLLLNECYLEIDNKPTFILFKELGSIALLLGFLQILAPTIQSIFGL